MHNEPITKEQRQSSRKRSHKDLSSRWQRVPDAASTVNVGLNTMRKLAAEAGAISRVCGVTLIDMEAVFAYIEKNRTTSAE